MALDCSLKSLTLPGCNELLQSHNSLTFKLLKTVADFSQALASLHDKFGHELQMLVETFRKRNGELRKERLQCPSSLFQIWELFLQQVEVNSQQHGDISRNFNQNIGNGLIERVFHRKIQSKKIFAHRDRIETILLKSNELLLKCYGDYCQAYALALTNPAQYLSEYIASHNVYVHQLQATNGMIHAYQTKTLPRLLEELEECQLETSLSISSSLLESCELVSEKSNEQAAGYQAITSACRQANHKQDLAQFVKAAAGQLASQASQANESSSPATGATGSSSAGNQQQQAAFSSSQSQPQSQSQSSSSLLSPSELGAGNELGLDKSATIRYHQFQSPSLQNTDLCTNQFDPKNMQLVPTFKNEIAPDLSQPPAQQQPQLEKDRDNLEEKIEKFEERIESLTKMLARSRDSRLNNKVNELQEELCQRRFDLLVAQIHLSAVRSQLQLFEYNYRPGVFHHHHVGGVGNMDAASSLQLAGLGGELAGLAAANQLAAAAAAVAAASTAGGGGLGSSSLSRKSSNNSGNQVATLGGYRNKWIKAFKSLKETPAPSGGASSQQISSSAKFAAGEEQLKQLAEAAGAQAQLQQQQQLMQANSQQAENQHFFQEYTFKKIASCDVCKDFLRGHMRQGVKCKLCKISCHNDCQSVAHATIKCQQPKIKLLRRQKSAGELEVNNSDADSADVNNERTLGSSKPDSIYQLIRQVLDAKKRGQTSGSHGQQHQQLLQHQQHQQQQEFADCYHLRPGQAPLGASNLMNLSTGNLALANQNGKSVSTSALGSSALAASVDRWAVVMDLLAQSRRKDKESGDDKLLADSMASGKRHSKQLDKFKLAAKSAAAASKHQRHYLQQQAQQQQQQQGRAQPASPPGAGRHEQLQQQPLPQIHHLAPGEAVGAAGGYLGQLSAQMAGGPAAAAASKQQQQQMLLQSTKSLPVGKLAPGQQQPAASQLSHLGPQLSAAGNHMALGAQASEQQMQNPYQPQQQQQLLNIGAQQMQSTSAPHSPQRRKFNLRMKSFSLDSPESPAAVGVVGGSAAAPGAGYQNHAHSGGDLAAGSGADLVEMAMGLSMGQHHSLEQQHVQQQQQQQQHHLQRQQPQYQFHRQQPQQYLGQTHHQLYQQQASYMQQQQQQAPALYSSQQQQQVDAGGQSGQPPQAAYLTSAVGGARHAPQANHQQALYHHRHSYHNPAVPAQYQPQQAQAAAGSQSALNSLHLVDQQQQQQQASSKLRVASSNPSKAALSNNQAIDNQQRRQFGSSESLLVRSDASQQQQSGQRNEYYDLNLDVGLRAGGQQAPGAASGSQSAAAAAGAVGGAPPATQAPPASSAGGACVVLYDYSAQRADELQLGAGHLVAVLDTSERDWWKVRPLDGSNRLGYFPASYLAKLYPNERPLQVAQTIQVSNGETCDKLLRGQIVIHTGKQMDSFVTIRTVTGDAPNHYIQCPEKYLMEVVEPGH